MCLQMLKVSSHRVKLFVTRFAEFGPLVSLLGMLRQVVGQIAHVLLLSIANGAFQSNLAIVRASLLLDLPLDSVGAP